MVKVNGTELDIAGKTLTEYLATTNGDYYITDYETVKI